MGTGDALFTSATVLSLHGATLATVVTANGVGYLLGPRFPGVRKWAALVAAIFLSIGIAVRTEADDISRWIVAFFNVFLIFTSAVGVTHLVAGQRQRRRRQPLMRGSSERRRAFGLEWF